MLSEEVPFVKRFGNWTGFRIRHEGLQSHGGNFFQHDGVVRSICRGLSPTKRRVAGDQDARHMKGISLSEESNDGVAGIGFVVRANLRRSERSGHRNGTMKIIGVCGAETRYSALGLSPRSSCSRGCVRNSTNRGK